ncbi:MAG: hypothetical protein II862_06085 [Bacteroidales bacterium]|nr:hypothetical protein [Bacteroidales bacterium]
MVNLGHYTKWRKRLQTLNGKVEYCNFWDKQSADEIWFTGFLKSRGFFERYPKADFVFFSTLGSAQLLRVDELLHPFQGNRKRIFFTGENVHYPVFKEYRDNLLDHASIDLSLGFDFVDNIRYMRFPIWILEMFPSNSSVDDIKRICSQLSFQRYNPARNRFCALVAGTSTMLGTESIEMRKQMVGQLNTIAIVDCAGKLLRNTEELQERFHDDKSEYLKNYKFFICPENVSVQGYVTEKVFHAIGSGCVPIYNGSLNNPEPDVLNHDAILFWEKNGDNTNLLQKVSDLLSSDNQYREFFEQPRLKEDAWQVVANYFDVLEQHLNDIFR